MFNMVMDTLGYFGLVTPYWYVNWAAVIVVLFAAGFAAAWFGDFTKNYWNKR